MKILLSTYAGSFAVKNPGGIPPIPEI